MVATVSAIYGLGDPESYFKMIMHLSRAEIIDQRGILGNWRNCSTRVTTLTFARHLSGSRRCHRYLSRGLRRLAVRMELFDEEIENIASLIH